MIIEFLDSSPFEAKDPPACSADSVTTGVQAKSFLQQTAWQTMTPQPSVLSSWLRTVPKRAIGISSPIHRPISNEPHPSTLTHFSLDCWHGEQGLFAQIAQAKGPVFVQPLGGIAQSKSPN